MKSKPNPIVINALDRWKNRKKQRSERDDQIKLSHSRNGVRNSIIHYRTDAGLMEKLQQSKHEGQSEERNKTRPDKSGTWDVVKSNQTKMARSMNILVRKLLQEL
jgi:hypothetical protein